MKIFQNNVVFSVFGVFLLVFLKKVNSKDKKDRCRNVDNMNWECVTNSECQLPWVCIEGKCKNPCKGACGDNTECHVMDAVPYCSCKKHYVGNPLMGCDYSSDDYDFTPAPRPFTPYTDSGEDTPVTQNIARRCNSDDDCYRKNEYCINSRCKNPCDSACGTKTTCYLDGKTPSCSCLPGYEGNPFFGCTRKGGGSCSRDDDCPDEMSCKHGKCESPCHNACGRNSNCDVYNGQARCSCKSNYNFNFDCKPIGQECATDCDCSGGKVCENNNCVVKPPPQSKPPCQVINDPNLTEEENKNKFCTCIAYAYMCPVPTSPPKIEPAKPKSKSYYMVRIALTWAEAVQYCASRGDQLMTIKSYEEDQMFIEIITQREVIRSRYRLYYWMRGVCMFNKYTCYWIDSWERLVFSRFHPIEPNFASREEICLAYSDYYDKRWFWVDAKCTSQNFFFCETYK